MNSQFPNSKINTSVTITSIVYYLFFSFFSVFLCFHLNFCFISMEIFKFKFDSGFVFNFQNKSTIKNPTCDVVSILFIYLLSYLSKYFWICSTHTIILRQIVSIIRLLIKRCSDINTYKFQQKIIEESFIIKKLF